MFLYLVFQDYEDFDLANENDELEDFLKFTPTVSMADDTIDNKSQSKTAQQNGNTSSREVQVVSSIHLLKREKKR